MKKLYIDITEAYLWHGKVTGIIRVMEELAFRFAKSDKIKTIFIAWDEKKDSFYEIIITDFISKRERDRTGETLYKKTGPINQPMYIDSFRVPFSRSFRKTKKFISKNAREFRENYDNYLVRKNRVKSFDRNSVLFMPHGGVWHSTTYTKKILELQERLDIKLVPIIYDMCPIVTPQYCSKGIRKTFQRYMSRVLPRADLIIAISKNTAADIERWAKDVINKPVPRIEIIKVGDQPLENKSNRPRTKKVPDDFILCVGTVEARKNHTVLYYAYKIAEQKKLNLLPVVVVGRNGWMAEDIYQIILNDPLLKGKFIFLHNISDSELSWLYKNARFSVYPSFYEGWGLPVAESLHNGLPCIASNTSSIPEIAGNLIDYFSPYSAEEVMEKIYHMSSDQKHYEQRKKDTQKYISTSWDSTYESVVTTLNKL